MKIRTFHVSKNAIHKPANHAANYATANYLANYLANYAAKNFADGIISSANCAANYFKFLQCSAGDGHFITQNIAFHAQLITFFK